FVLASIVLCKFSTFSFLWLDDLCFLHVSTFFFFIDTATTEIYTLSLHDAPPISPYSSTTSANGVLRRRNALSCSDTGRVSGTNRSEEHTSELQSRENLVCRLLLEKKKNITSTKKKK